MSKKQLEAIEFFKLLFPEEFGIKKAYYKIEENEICLTFFVEERKVSSLISYIKSLSFLLEEKFNGIKLKNSIYVYEDRTKVNKVVKKDNLEQISLSKKLKLSPAC